MKTSLGWIINPASFRSFFGCSGTAVLQHLRLRNWRNLLFRTFKLQLEAWRAARHTWIRTNSRLSCVGFVYQMWALLLYTINRIKGVAATGPSHGGEEMGTRGSRRNIAQDFFPFSTDVDNGIEEADLSVNTLTKKPESAVLAWGQILQQFAAVTSRRSDNSHPPTTQWSLSKRSRFRPLSPTTVYAILVLLVVLVFDFI